MDNVVLKVADDATIISLMRRLVMWSNSDNLSLSKDKMMKMIMDMGKEIGLYQLLTVIGALCCEGGLTVSSKTDVSFWQSR